MAAWDACATGEQEAGGLASSSQEELEPALSASCSGMAAWLFLEDDRLGEQNSESANVSRGIVYCASVEWWTHRDLHGDLPRGRADPPLP
jgi:hypothetical protein